MHLILPWVSYMNVSHFPSLTPTLAVPFPTLVLLCIFLFFCSLPSQSHRKTDVQRQAEVASTMGQKRQKGSQPGPGIWEVEQGEIAITIQCESRLLCFGSCAIEGPAWASVDTTSPTAVYPRAQNFSLFQYTPKTHGLGFCLLGPFRGAVHPISRNFLFTFKGSQLQPWTSQLLMISE